MTATTARKITANAIESQNRRLNNHAADIVGWIEREFISIAAKSGKNAVVVTTYELHNRFDSEAEKAINIAIALLTVNGFDVIVGNTIEGTIYKICW
jgi:hypothetical protein